MAVRSGVMELLTDAEKFQCGLGVNEHNFTQTEKQ